MVMVQQATAGSTLMKKAQSKNRGIIAVDNGGEYTKVASDKGVHMFRSDKAFGWKMNVGYDDFSDGDYAVVWNDVLYFVGDVVIRENNDFTIDGNVSSKTNDYFILSILLACAEFGYEENYLITSIPIRDHADDIELETIKKRLLGTHTIEVNNQTKTFHVRSVNFAAEGMNAFWMFEPEGKTRWLDVASRTVNFATMQYDGGDTQPYAIDSESGTIDLGLRKSRVTNYKQYVKIIENTVNRQRWNNDDSVYLVGGGANIDELVTELQSVFPNLVLVEDPQLVQVQGMLLLGKVLIDLD